MAREPISKKLRFEILERDKFACQYCGAQAPGVKLHVDHIKSVFCGGRNTPSNLITACEACNLGKGAKSLNTTPADEDIFRKIEFICGMWTILNGDSFLIDKNDEFGIRKHILKIIHDGGDFDTIISKAIETKTNREIDILLQLNKYEPQDLSGYLPEEVWKWPEDDNRVIN